MSAVAAGQRFKKAHPCPICGGFDDALRGKGERCFGFLSDDGKYAHCCREEFGGALPLESNSATFAHRLAGSCKCGTSHSPSPRLVDKPAKLKFVTAYDYPDAEGTLSFQVIRYDPKSFKQRRPDGSGGWIWDLKGVQRILYNLPALLTAGEVYICEGERDADTVAGWGLVATTNSGGAGKWRDEYTAPLKGKAVVIFPDADAPGRRHVLKVAGSLLGVANSVKVVELPAHDVADWGAKGGSRESLLRLAGEEPSHWIDVR